MEYRAANDGDLAAILELFSISLGAEGGIPEERFWRWKHLENPFGKSPTLLAFADDKLVGLRTFLCWRFTYGGEKILAYRAVDTATHPDYRGHGIFRKLTLSLIDSLKPGEPSFIFNTPNDLSRPGYIKMGWKVAGVTPLYLRPYLRGLVENRFRKGQNEIAENQHDAGFASAWDSLSEGFRSAMAGSILTDYSFEYLKWRYLDIPGFTYRFRIADDCMIVYRVRERKLKELRITELITRSGSSSNVRRELAALISHVRPDVITILNDHRNIIRSSLPAGFIKASRFGLTVTTREINDPSLVELFVSKPWALSAGTFELL